MTLPFMFALPSPGEPSAQSPAGVATQNLASGLLASVEGWSFPLALLRPLESLFAGGPSLEKDNFLAGLHADNFLGAGILPASGKRQTPLAWVGVELGSGSKNLFTDLRGGCWIPGHPSIGRGRELLRAAGVADAAGLKSLLAEIGFTDSPSLALYFNFHFDQPEADCARVYVLDVAVRCLHGLALPSSALAPTKVN